VDYRQTVCSMMPTFIFHCSKKQYEILRWIFLRYSNFMFVNFHMLQNIWPYSMLDKKWSAGATKHFSSTVVFQNGKSCFNSFVNSITVTHNGLELLKILQLYHKLYTYFTKNQHHRGTNNKRKPVAYYLPTALKKYTTCCYNAIFCLLIFWTPLT